MIRVATRRIPCTSTPCSLAPSPGAYPPEVLDELRLDVPVAVYSEGRSTSTLQAITRRIAENLPDASLFEIPEATHGVQHSGEAFDRHLVAIIDAVESAGAA